MQTPQNVSTLKKFKQNILGVFSVLLISLAALVAIFGYIIAPDSTTNANTMHLNIAFKPMGFSIQVLKIPLEHFTENSWATFKGSAPKYEERAIAQYKIEKEELWIQPYENKNTDYFQKVDTKPFGKSSLKEIEKDYIEQKTFYLGTDKYGRDFLSRIILGTRISFAIGFIAVFISLIIGISMGMLGGYYGGFIDKIIMWFINVLWSIPTLLMVIAITLALGKGFWQVFFAVGLTMWVEVARIVRGQFLSEKEKEYIEAARSLGLGDLRIMTKHMLPNVLGPVIVISAANFAAAILIESGLSFLGIGAQPPTPTWGTIIKEHYSNIVLGQPHLALIPGLCILLLVLAFILIGNTLRDILDVKN